MSWSAAFERIEAARGEVGASTFFEFNTLAALLIFEAAALDAWVLEIGMGGRLDAVNVVDPDVAVVVSIGFDHQEYLGTTLEAIAREKAGIFRTRPAGRARQPRHACHRCRSSRGRSARRSSAWASNTATRIDTARWQLPRRSLGLARTCRRRRSWATSQYANAATAIAALEEIAPSRVDDSAGGDSARTRGDAARRRAFKSSRPRSRARRRGSWMWRTIPTPRACWRRICANRRRRADPCRVRNLGRQRCGGNRRGIAWLRRCVVVRIDRRRARPQRCGPGAADCARQVTVPVEAADSVGRGMRGGVGRRASPRIESSSSVPSTPWDRRSTGSRRTTCCRAPSFPNILRRPGPS